MVTSAQCGGAVNLKVLADTINVNVLILETIAENVPTSCPFSTDTKFNFEIKPSGEGKYKNTAGYSGTVKF